MEVVDAIAAVATDPQDNKPLEDVSIIRWILFTVHWNW